MNFQNLEYFITVAKERNITRAAESLGITQQALSNQISRLEQELTCSLFDRKNGFELTPSGRCFYDSAVRILDINQETANLLNDINDNQRGELRIGISFSRGQAVLPLLLPDFQRIYPHVTLRVTEGTTEALEAAFEKGQIDLLLEYAPFSLDSAVTTNLIREKAYLAVPRSLIAEHFGEDADKVIEEYHKKPDLKVFKDFPFVMLKEHDRIRSLMLREFTYNGVSPHIVMETQNIQTAFVLATEGLGIAVVPEIYLKSPYTVCSHENPETDKKVVILPFPGNRYIDTVAIGYNSSRYVSKIAKSFIELTEKKFRQLAGE